MRARCLVDSEHHYMDLNNAWACAKCKVKRIRKVAYSHVDTPGVYVCEKCWGLTNEGIDGSKEI